MFLLGLRVQFCNKWTRMCRETRGLVSKVLWTDESIFNRSGKINRRNTVKWSVENPGFTREVPIKSKGVTVFAGIHAGGVFGPFFLTENVNGEPIPVV